MDYHRLLSNFSNRQKSGTFLPKEDNFLIKVHQEPLLSAPNPIFFSFFFCSLKQIYLLHHVFEILVRKKILDSDKSWIFDVPTKSRK